MPKVTAHLELFSTSSAAQASLTFRNEDTTPAFLEKSKIFYDGSIENNLFRIVSGDRKISYVGIMAKRAEPGPNEFLKLEAGQQFKVTVDLANVYDFLPGRHTYRAHYSAFHSYPGNQDFWSMKSNEVEFAFSR